MKELIKESLMPFWRGVMRGESVILVERCGRAAGKLMFVPKGPVRVTAGGKLFREVLDYKVYGNEIIALSDKLPRIMAEWLSGENLPKEIEKYQGMYGLGKHLFAESSFFMARQISVDYSYNADEWKFNFARFPENILPRFKKLLLKKAAIKIILYGDSISMGISSKNYNIPPYLPPWFELFTLALENKYGAKIELFNISEGGRSAAWAAEHIAERQGAREADLMIIAFGMNDATGHVPKDEFIKDIRRLMDYQRNDCEFILIGNMVANPACPFTGDYRGLANALKALQNEHTAAVDVGALHEYLLTRKNYLDMTQNNVNHPDDFLSRCYAISLLEIFN